MKHSDQMIPASNIVSHFIQSNNTNTPDITDDDIQLILLPIQTAINDSQRKNAQNNFQYTNNNNSYNYNNTCLRSAIPTSSKRTLTTPGSTIRGGERSRKAKGNCSEKGRRSNFVLQRNDNGEFVLGRKEAKVTNSIGKMKLRNQMLNMVLCESKDNKNKPPKFQLEKKPEIPRFEMETNLVDDINDNNKYISKISFQY